MLDNKNRIVKYIDAEKLKVEIDNLESFSCISEEEAGFYSAVSRISDIIDSLQQEQQTDKQVVVITESHGDANIEWDCRSLNDVIELLKSAEYFISDKQVEKLRGPGCGPDYDTMEGRYSKPRKSQQEVDLEEVYDAYCKVCGHYHHTTPAYICRQSCDYFEDFKALLNARKK